MFAELFTTLSLPPLAYVVLILAVTLMLKSWMNRPTNLPPMPAKPYPIMGHLPYFKKDPRGTMLKWAEETGDVFSIYMGSRHVVVLNTYDVLKETLVKNADIFTDRPPTYIGECRDYGEKGLLFSSGSEWKEQRSVSMSIMRDFGMGKNSLVEKIQEELSFYLNELSKSKGKITDVRTVTNASVANIICSIIVGRRFEYDDPYFLNFLSLFNEQVQLVAGNAMFTWFPWLRYLPFDYFKAKRILQIVDEVNEYFSDRYITKTKKEFDESNIDNFIGAYMKVQQKKEKSGQPTTMDALNLTRVIGNLFVAGSETTSTTILWFLLFMIRHPDIQKKIYQEIDEVVGTERLPTMNDKSKMNYLNAAVMETQRRASIVPYSVPHQCTADTIVRGYTIPKNTRIWPNLDAVLLDKKTWGDPMNYRPERFLDDKKNLVSPEEFIPFSLGRRMCMGESLAKMELYLFCAALIQKFEILPATSDLPPEKGVFGITCAPLPYDMKLVERRT